MQRTGHDFVDVPHIESLLSSRSRVGLSWTVTDYCAQPLPRVSCFTTNETEKKKKSQSSTFYRLYIYVYIYTYTYIHINKTTIKYPFPHNFKYKSSIYRYIYIIGICIHIDILSFIYFCETHVCIYTDIYI